MYITSIMYDYKLVIPLQCTSSREALVYVLVGFI